MTGPTMAETMTAIRAGLTACRGCGAPRGDEDQDVDHRPDCTVDPSALICDECDEIRLPSQKAPLWEYDPGAKVYRCSTHRKGTK